MSGACRLCGRYRDLDSEGYCGCDSESVRIVESFCGDDPELLLFVGTCQTCGSYWDVRQRKFCLCGGEVL